MSDVWSALQHRRRQDGGAPVVTFLGSGGARVELSAASLENAAAKVAGALVEEFDLDGGAVVDLQLPVHWQRAAWLAGCWTARTRVALDGVPTEEPVDLVVTTGARIARATQVAEVGVTLAVVSDHPLGLPITVDLPVGVVDATPAVRSAPDSFLGLPPAATDPALVAGIATLTQEEVLDLARDRAADWGLEPGGRLLVVDGVDPLDGWLAALAVPLALSASVVLVAADSDADLDRTVAQENVTALLHRDGEGRADADDDPLADDEHPV